MRPTTATIDLAALRHNLSVARRHAPRSGAFAVIKANAYGHGLLRCARAIPASVSPLRTVYRPVATDPEAPTSATAATTVATASHRGARTERLTAIGEPPGPARLPCRSP